MAENVNTLQKKYDELLQKSKDGDKAAFREKGIIGSQLREAKREVNRQDKRSLQEQYVRQYDGDTPVEIARKAGEKPEPTTLREHHAKRLGVKP